MQLPQLILLTLAAVATLILLVRHRWPTLGARARRAILASAIGIIVLFLAARVTHWETDSDRLNTLFYLAALSGYLLLLAVHSLTRPRWLTSLTAVVLAAPILASSIFLPLAGLFEPNDRRVVPLANNLYASWKNFTELGTSNSGTQIEIFYRPPALPFLRHPRLGGRFYYLRCNAPATEIVLQPDGQSVFVRCPPWPNASESSPGEILRLHH